MADNWDEGQQRLLIIEDRVTRILEMMARIEERSQTTMTALSSNDAAKQRTYSRLDSLESWRSWLTGLVMGVTAVGGVVLWSLSSQLEEFKGLPATVAELRRAVTAQTLTKPVGAP